MKLVNVIQSCIKKAELDVNQERSFVKKDKVGFDESERLISPYTSVARIWNTASET
jgi:hypothetical protein